MADDKKIIDARVTVEQFGRYFKRSFVSKSRRVEIDESEYERSHGKSPRGHGNWAFALENPLYVSSSRTAQCVWFTGPYSVVKRHAQLVAAILNVTTIYTRS